jgi:uncharacterized protein (TIGR02466 family)
VSLKTLFVTEIYLADLKGTPDFAAFLDDLDDTCRAMADEDEAGHLWSQQKTYLGYTSYGSIPDLVTRASLFSDLKRHLDVHAARFAEALEFDLGKTKLKLDSLWINILDPYGTHSGHIHPHSVISGTFYVAVPKGSGAIKFEDPRLERFMAAPPRLNSARLDHQAFVYEMPEPGMVIMWESWLRHEVIANMSDEVRISLSFNYSW